MPAPFVREFELRLLCCRTNTPDRQRHTQAHLKTARHKLVKQARAAMSGAPYRPFWRFGRYGQAGSSDGCAAGLLTAGMVVK
jgi:hypothetical protein